MGQTVIRKAKNMRKLKNEMKCKERNEGMKTGHKRIEKKRGRRRKMQKLRVRRGERLNSAVPSGGKM